MNMEIGALGCQVGNIPYRISPTICIFAFDELQCWRSVDNPAHFKYSGLSLQRRVRKSNCENKVLYSFPKSNYDLYSFTQVKLRFVQFHPLSNYINAFCTVCQITQSLCIVSNYLVALYSSLYSLSN